MKIKVKYVRFVTSVSLPSPNGINEHTYLSPDADRALYDVDLIDFSYFCVYFKGDEKKLIAIIPFQAARYAHPADDQDFTSLENIDILLPTDELDVHDPLNQMPQQDFPVGKEEVIVDEQSKSGAKKKGFSSLQAAQ